MTEGQETFARYDLRMRSIDRKPGEPIDLCPCGAVAEWSVWLHTPEWGRGNAGETRVSCYSCAIADIAIEAGKADD